MKKTNAVRELELSKIVHKLREYEVDENHLDAVSVALKIGEDVTQVFKTIVLMNEKKEMLVACIPGIEKIDLKKLAKISGSKKVEMVLTKELLSLTGYIRGGCSPIGIKRKHRTYIDELALNHKEIIISGGTRGLQIKINSLDLINYLGAKVGNIVENVEIE